MIPRGHGKSLRKFNKSYSIHCLEIRLSLRDNLCFEMEQVRFEYKVTTTSSNGLDFFFYTQRKQVQDPCQNLAFFGICLLYIGHLVHFCSLFLLLFGKMKGILSTRVPRLYPETLEIFQTTNTSMSSFLVYTNSLSWNCFQ